MDNYFATPGLSNSGMKDLAVSPLRYWFRHVNPERPADDPTPEMQIGSALHCAILEIEQFDKRYACELIPPNGALDTMNDLRGFLRENGQTPKGTRKDEAIAQVQAFAPKVPIKEVLERAHAQEHAGKVIFSVEDWQRIAGMSHALAEEPQLQAIFDAGGKPEAEIFSKDAETGVPLKAKLDWLAPTLTLDLKTLSIPRGKSVGRAMTDVLWREGYIRQAVLYSILRGWPAEFGGEFVFAFVESQPPFEVRLRSVYPKSAGQLNLYWQTALVEIRSLIRTYKEYSDHFGEKPWRYACQIDPVDDEDLPQILWSSGVAA